MRRALLVLLLAFMAPQADADAFRCGTKLVVEGDTRSQVRAKCGEPTDVDTRVILRRPIVWVYGRPFYVGEGLVEVPVETWTYNLGPHKLMRRVEFVDGQVERIETLSHGYR